MIDVLIIGAGPIGLAAGIEAEKNGLSYLIVEKGVLVNSLYHYPDRMTFFSTSEKLEIGGVPFVSHNPKPTRQEALEYYRRVALKFDLNINLYEKINSIQKTETGFEVTTSRGLHHCRNIVLGTGFYDLPNKLDVPGEDLPKVLHYYNDPHPYFKQKVAVVGAQNSAIDAALECYRKGAEVTLIHRGPEVGKRVKYWVRPDIVNRIEEGSIKAYFNTSVTEITERSIKISQEGKSHTLKNDFVLALTGYQPNFSLLRSAGVTIREEDAMKPVYNPETMESDVEGIYLAGVVVGGLKTSSWFIENSRVHAAQIMETIARKQEVIGAE